MATPRGIRVSLWQKLTHRLIATVESHVATSRYKPACELPGLRQDTDDSTIFPDQDPVRGSAAHGQDRVDPNISTSYGDRSP